MSVLTSGLFKSLRHLPAVLPDAATVSLGANSVPTPIFSYPGLKATGRLISLMSLQQGGVSGIQWSVQADGQVLGPYDAAAAALWDPSDPLHTMITRATVTGRLEVLAQNTTATAVDLLWSNASVLVQEPSIAEKLQYPSTFPLTAGEKVLATKYGLAQNPALPKSFREIIDTEYRPFVSSVVPLGKTLTTSSTLQAVATVTPNAGEMLVLTGLAVSPGSGSDGLTVQVGIDEDTSLLQLPAYGLGSGKPVFLFIPATQMIQIALSSTTAVTASCSALVWHVRLTDAMRVRLGAITSGPVYDQVTAGVL